MQSMTGYGKAEYSKGGVTLTVEVKTVNNRFLDIIPKYPRCFVQLDDLIRKTVQSKLARGRVELFITYENTDLSGKTVCLDEDLAEQYVRAAETLSARFGIEDDLTVTRLMRLPDVLTEKIKDENADKLGKILSNTLADALDALNAMRKVEGEKLKADLLARSETVEELVSELSQVAHTVKYSYEKKIKERIAEVMGEAEYDESRLLQEVALFADKSDITEELTRLKSHISQLCAICAADNDAGKKLDFLMQEFNREANTVCSKANDVGVTQKGLALKNEIEKMREQVQNIE